MPPRAALAEEVSRRLTVTQWTQSHHRQNTRENLWLWYWLNSINRYGKSRVPIGQLVVLFRCSYYQNRSTNAAINWWHEWLEHYLNDLENKLIHQKKVASVATSRAVTDMFPFSGKNILGLSWLMQSSRAYRGVLDAIMMISLSIFWNSQITQLWLPRPIVCLQISKFVRILSNTRKKTLTS